MSWLALLPYKGLYTSNESLGSVFYENACFQLRMLHFNVETALDLIPPRKLFSYFLKSNVRKDFVYAVMADYWDEGPSGGYHQQCYQAYANKEHLGRI